MGYSSSCRFTLTLLLWTLLFFGLADIVRAVLIMTAAVEFAALQQEQYGFRQRKLKLKRKRKCQNSKTCHSTKVLAYNTALMGGVLWAYGVESMTNGGRYL